MTRIFTLIFLSLMLSVNVVAQDHIRIVPKSSELILSIEDLERFSRVSVAMFDELVDSESVDEIFKASPQLSLSSDEWEAIKVKIKATLKDLSRFAKITFFIEEVNPEIRFGAILEAKKGANLKRFARWDDVDISDFCEKVVAAAQPRQSDSQVDSYLQSIFSGIRDLQIKRLDDVVIVANSPDLIEVVARRCESNRRGELKRKDTILNNRRYLRTVEKASKIVDKTCFIYLKPLSFVAPLYGQPDRVALRKLGLNEIVGCGIAITLSENTNRPSQPAVAIRCLSPVTFPLSGEALNWSLSKPIEEIPTFESDPDWQWIGMHMENRDHLAYLESYMEMHDSINGLGSYRDLLESKWRYFGGFKAYRDSWTGEKIRCWIKKDWYNGTRLVEFKGVEDHGMVEDSIDQVAKKSKKFPLQKSIDEKNDQIRWYLSADKARKLYTTQNSGKTPDTVENRGWLLTDKWLMAGDIEFSNIAFTSKSPRRVVSELFQGGSAIFEQGAKPSFVSLHWLSGSYIYTIRKSYLRSLYSRRKASQIFGKLLTKELSTVPLTTEADKAYAVFEAILFNWAGHYGRNATSFEFKESFADFRYLAFRNDK